MPNYDFDKANDNEDTDTDTSTNSDTSSGSTNTGSSNNKHKNKGVLGMMDDYDGSDDVVLWEARDGTDGDWREGQIVYTYNQAHAVSNLILYSINGSKK